MAVDKRHAHLDEHRPVILGRAAIASALGLLPVPFLDELLAGQVRVTLLRHIADARKVDAEEAALSIIAVAAAPNTSATSASMRSAFRLVFRRSFRRVFAVARIAGRADDVASTFAVATLFDHYCARHHLGPGIDEALSRTLRAAIEASIGEARGHFARRGFAHLRRGAANLLVDAPRLVFRLVGRLPALRSRPLPSLTERPKPDRNDGGRAGDAERDQNELGTAPAPLVAEFIDPGAPITVARQAAVPARGNLVERSALVIADVLSDSGRSWVEELTRAFDARWTVAASHR